MNSFDSDLAHAIMMKSGLRDAPGEVELANIKREITAIRDTGKIPSEADWQTVVRKYCKSVYLREGVDNSDLNTLLLLAIQASEK